MDSALSAQISRRVIAAIDRQQYHQVIKRTIPRRIVASSSNAVRRHASSSSSPRPPPASSPSSPSSSSSSKPIILEQPDKFRPPSHPARLNTRKTTASYGGTSSYQGGYNQDVTAREREQQAKKSYPNMFPNQGSFMHWFLTNRIVHLWISLGTLTLLAIFSLSQNFMKTSPFAHLVPPFSSILSHPISYIRECSEVFRLHTDYISDRTAKERQERILDAQKRRIYRRAHGMEDMEAQESQGVDITGLVDWDDGLTNRERERGGRLVTEMEKRARKAFQLSEEKAYIGSVAGSGVEDLEEVLRQEEEREREMRLGQGLNGGVGSGASVEEGEEGSQPQPQKKRVKRWLGIWE